MTSISTKAPSKGESGSSPSSNSPSSPAIMLNPVVEITPISIDNPPSSSAIPSTSQSALPSAVTIKREVASEEIKEFAETAMNELLGWYGYGTDQTLNKDESAAGGQPANGGGKFPKKDSSPLRNRPARTTRRNDHRPPPPPTSAMTTETRSPHSHSLSNSPPRSTSSPSANENYLAANTTINTCDWCHRKISPDAETYGTTEGVRFCSEACFSQSRRATFKRAKTCDWCRHVRHAVSYVDFQDGASQLQFCSDKCLNQYKMQIFIKETQAHLEMNPHLMEQGEGSVGSLITPELWLKNCRSRSASPVQSRSRSGSPEPMRRPEPTTDIIPTNLVINRPTITVAPVSKLLQPKNQTPAPHPPPPPSPFHVNHLLHTAELMAPRSMKTMRKRRTVRNGSTPVQGDLQQHFPISRSPATDNEAISASQSSTPLFRRHQISNEPAELQKHPTAIEQQNPANLTEQMSNEHFDHRFLSPPPNLFPIRTHPMPTATVTGSNPQILRPPPGDPRLPPLPNLRPATSMPQQSFPYPPSPYLSLAPPVTVLVPCPIILPIPVPIPIPINIAEFLEKLLATEAANKALAESINSRSEQRTTSQEQNDLNNNNNNNILNKCSTSIQNRFVDEGNYTTSNQNRQPDDDGDDDQRKLNSDHEESSGNESSSMKSKSAQESVPKIKITRLQSKRILTGREMDSNRPLRKRKRIIVDAYT